ncbi:MAG: filamentous hemagglutinin N-terminal domain-containing protein [Rhabdochlamydiaceae bacterium]|nr:filamentous hemagglutinin N-terminal domain-containing protein [Rhabdochlamydiaceae bacterium]
MRKRFFWFTTVASLTVGSTFLMALPQSPSVISGDVSFQQQSHEMSIHASDRSIIHYQNFDIQKGEKVKFIQPSSSSCVLNRVQGGKSSEILGKMESNGKVLLVNPNGMYFGPHASVKTASFIASTLDVANEDFLRGKYFFSLQNKERLTEIRNEGLLEASAEGCIVLMAPQIYNSGTIQAQSGKVVLAAGEQVTLDFQGDRLLQFTVEGDIKGAILQHLGSIQADGGEVSMRLPTAKKAIRDIVNHAGMEKGEAFVRQNGEIFLVSGSSIAATKVDIEASVLSIDGKIDVSNLQKQGGSVKLSGAEIALRGAYIDASGKTGGGEVLIGGDVQGHGSMPHAVLVSMDSDSQILSNAIEKGQGGTVVLWSRQKTEFEGGILAQGGPVQGDGGFVETSGLESLFSMKGYVDTSAAQGLIGQWLLDPSTLNVISGAVPSNPGCIGGFVGIDSFTSSSSDVTLCSTYINIQVASIDMSVSGAGLLFTSRPNEQGVLHFEGDLAPAIAINTTQGKVVVTNMDIVLDKDTIIDTTMGGTYPVGAGIILQDVNASNLGVGLGLNAGASQISLGDIGLVFPLKTITVNADTIYAQNVITQQGGDIHFLGPVILKTNAVFDTTRGGGNITLKSVDSIRPGSSSFVVSAGTGTVLIQGVGNNTPLGDFSVTSGVDGVVTGDVYTQYGTVDIIPTLQLVQPHTVIKTFSELNNYQSASIILGDVVPSIPDLESLFLLTGLKGSVTVGNVGREDSFLRDLIVTGNQLFSVQDVLASNVTINTLSGPVLFDGSMTLVGDLTVVDSSSITLNGPITAENIRLQSRDSIFNQGVPYPITLSDSGLSYLNAGVGQIGTQKSPVTLNTSGQVILGGNPIFLEGNYSDPEYIPGRGPCLIRVKGHDIACALAHKVIFDGLRKSNFARSFHFNIINLGINFPVNWYNNMQFSPFAPLKAVSGNLPPIPNSS